MVKVWFMQCSLAIAVGHGFNSKLSQSIYASLPPGTNNPVVFFQLGGWPEFNNKASST